MSLRGSANLLRIDLRPSRQYKTLVISTHLLTLLPLAWLSWFEPLYLFLLPLIWLSLRHSLHDYATTSGWRHLRLYDDGRLDRLEEGGGRVRYQLLHTPFILPWIIVLPLGLAGRRRWLPLLPDSLEHEQWRELRLFLRYYMKIPD